MRRSDMLLPDVLASLSDAGRGPDFGGIVRTLFKELSQGGLYQLPR